MTKLDDFEKNGLGTIFKEIKGILVIFLTDEKTNEISRKFKNGRYEFILESDNKSYFSINLLKDNSKNSNVIDISNGLDKLTIEEIDNLIKCILKDFIIVNNFNEYNERKDLDFYYDVSNDNNIDNIKVGVKNKKEEPLRITYWE